VFEIYLNVDGVAFSLRDVHPNPLYSTQSRQYLRISLLDLLLDSISLVDIFEIRYTDGFGICRQRVTLLGMALFWI
jgi:hypothetical protein